MAKAAEIKTGSKLVIGARTGRVELMTEYTYPNQKKGEYFWITSSGFMMQLHTSKQSVRFIAEHKCLPVMESRWIHLDEVTIL